MTKFSSAGFANSSRNCFLLDYQCSKCPQLHFFVINFLSFVRASLSIGKIELNLYPTFWSFLFTFSCMKYKENYYSLHIYHESLFSHIRCCGKASPCSLYDIVVFYKPFIWINFCRYLCPKRSWCPVLTD